MGIDVLFLAWNRLEFTRFTFGQLLANTDWDLVDRLVVYDDGSEDGTTALLYEMIHACPATYELRETPNVGPVEIMNRYVETSDADFFFKTDNDIVLPPGYLPAMLGVLALNPQIDALGCEAGRTLYPALAEDGWASVGAQGTVYGYEPGSHIGGIGLIRTEALGRRPRLNANGEGGRYGWTEFQSQWNLERGWIQPDIPVCSLDQVPFDPWQRYALQYQKRGWSRNTMWPQYHARWMARYWAWWAPEEVWRDAYEGNVGS